MTRNQAEELANVLKHLQGNEELQEVLECAEAIISTTINGREERIAISLPQRWCKEDLVEFYAGINQPEVTLRKCTVWLSTSNNTAWLQYDCEYPTDHPVWGYHEDEPGSRRPQIPNSLKHEAYMWLETDSPFGVEWFDIPEKYKYLAVDYYSPGGEEGAVFAYQNKPYVPEVEEEMWSCTSDNIAEFMKVGSIPLDELPGPWYKCIAKRPGA